MQTLHPAPPEPLRMGPFRLECWCLISLRKNIKLQGISAHAHSYGFHNSYSWCSHTWHRQDGTVLVGTSGTTTAPAIGISSSSPAAAGHLVWNIWNISLFAFHFRSTQCILHLFGWKMQVPGSPHTCPLGYNSAPWLVWVQKVNSAAEGHSWVFWELPGEVTSELQHSPSQHC